MISEDNLPKRGDRLKYQDMIVTVLDVFYLRGEWVVRTYDHEDINIKELDYE
jgi:hypothetical protein